MSINHRRLDVLVPEELLNGANIVPIFKEVGGEAVAECVRGDRLVDVGEASRLFHSPLQVGFIQVVTLFESADRIDGHLTGRKNILPGELAVGRRIFSFEGIGKVDRAIALREVEVVLCFDLPEVQPQRLKQNVREQGEAVILALAIADNDLMIGKVEILDTQAHDFHQTEARTIHDLSHQPVDAIQMRDDLPGLLAGEDGRDALRPGGADGNESPVIQFNLQNIAVKKEDGADGLILGGGGDVFLVDKVGDEGVDLVHTHLARVAFVMVEDVLAYPADIGLFGAERVVAVAEEFAVLFEQFFALRSILRMGALRRAGRTIGFPRRDIRR